MLGRSILAFSLLSCTIALHGQGVPESPFETPSTNPAVTEAPAVVTSLDAFQFSGIWKMGGEIRISVYDTKEQRGYWLKEGELGALGLSFQRFDPDNKTVVLVQGVVTKKLSLNKVKIEPLKIASSAPSNNSAPTTRPSPPPSVGNARTETDEEARARIQKVAEEIRRRRAERRKQLENRGN